MSPIITALHKGQSTTRWTRHCLIRTILHPDEIPCSDLQIIGRLLWDLHWLAKQSTNFRHVMSPKEP